GAAMAFVVRIELIHSSGGFRQIAECHNSATGREPVVQTSVLDEHGAATGQITHAAVAEPAAAHLHVTVFWHAEFGARVPDELAIGSGRPRNDFTGCDLPAAVFEQRGFNAHLCDLKFL